MASRKAKSKSRGKTASKRGKSASGGGFGAVVGGAFAVLFGDRERTVRTLSNTVSTLIVLGVAAGVVFGRGPMREAAAAALAEEPAVRFDWPTDAERHEWMSAGQKDRLERRVLSLLAEPGDPQRGLERAHAFLASTGWLEGLRLLRGPGGVVEVEGRWRAPFAEVRQDRLDGVWVVGEDAAPIDTTNDWVLPKVVGVRYDPFGPTDAAGDAAGGKPSVYGYPWGTGEVEAGIALLKAVRAVHGGDQVAGVDVSGYTKRPPQLVIVTDRANRIQWGGPVGAPNPGEPSDEHKLSMLVRAFELTGRVDAGERQLDLRTGRIEVDRTATPANGERTPSGG